MSKSLKYVPILRGRQEEFKIFRTFEFGDRIFPCIEIIKETDRLLGERKKGAKPKPKSFEGDYIPLIRDIKAKHVFVDLPVHLKQDRGMKVGTLKFLGAVVSKKEKRNEYMLKFASLAPKVIPVISTYAAIGGKAEIKFQETELREKFNVLAFRTFMKSFSQDMAQIEPVLKKTDYVIMDWDNEPLDLEDGDQVDIVEHLKKLNCHVVIHRNAYDSSISNVSLKHGELVEEINNGHIIDFKKFAGMSFSDYSGIKKDYLGGGGTTSPGFVYYDSVNNEFYGFRFEHGGHRKGQKLPDLKEFETRIVPDVIKSAASKRMQKHALDYLNVENIGWFILNSIASKKESGKNAAKFKRIGLGHYLHCMKTRIANGDFE